MTSFRFTNRDGVSRVGRYRYIPLAGAAYLSDAEEDRAPVDYLMDELRQRLAKGPAQFRLVVQLAAEGDPTHDPTIVWPEDRPQVELGTLTLQSTVADSVIEERSLLFDPGRLTDGIDYSDDPLPRDRSGAYAVSFAWRNPT